MAFYFQGNPIKFFCQKHKCPSCHNKLKLRMKTDIINRESADYKKYKFSLESDEDMHYPQNVKIKHFIFQCDSCLLDIEGNTLFSLKKYEKQKQKLYRKLYKLNSNLTIEEIKTPLREKYESLGKILFEDLIINVEFNQQNIRKIIFVLEYNDRLACEPYIVKTKEYKQILKETKKLNRQ